MGYLIVLIGVGLLIYFFFQMGDSGTEERTDNYIYGKRESSSKKYMNGEERLERKKEKDRLDAVERSREILSDRNQYLIIDTETTGLGERDIIIQVGMIDLESNILMDQLIKPTKRKTIPKDSTAIHGITMDDLETAPYFEQVIGEFQEKVKGKTVLIYNARYDLRLFAQTMKQDKISEMFNMEVECIMDLYSEYVGKWSDYHQNYTWQGLRGGDHTAIGDCLATLELIKKMAENRA